MSSGIAAWGTYLPFWRLQRSAIKGVLGSGGGRGTRAVASHDEDTTTLGVEAGRRALAVGPGAAAVQDLFFSTPDPAYLDKTSATTVHAALGLGRGLRCLRLHRLFAVGDGCAAPGAGSGIGRQRSHHPGGDLGPAHRPGGLGRGARQRGRRRRAAVRAGRRGGRADRPGCGERRVPRPLARPRRGGLARLGGALRRRALRAAGPRGLCGRARRMRGWPRATSITPS